MILIIQIMNIIKSIVKIIHERYKYLVSTEICLHIVPLKI